MAIQKGALSFLLLVAVAGVAQADLFGFGKDKNLNANYGKVYWYNEVTGESSWHNPLPVHKNDNGDVYYVDKNGEATWDKPEEVAWMAVPSEEYPGRDYYWNEKTREVSWDKPAPLAWKSKPVTKDLKR
eukprot:CAMPEP_0182912970 /NCGR_PEP_ID=MMETSP0034_2-20130328/37796_1 /TAXON_ID=156128 /ORGANISM="Nephroselmis pyriformis, Strain CCMP717" /LENGTH=128 /DNA_ID=CAMNT_0025049667 /DNA_START=28 /DNA_END=414 /DNA_ORIENTATION=-